MKGKVALLAVAGVAYAYSAMPQTAATITGTHHAPAVYAVAPSANEALANQMAASLKGWHGIQLTCLDDLWTEESGFSSTALNSSSGATGIPQLLPSVHQIPANWSDPRVQIRWGLQYVQDRYGSPCAAWAFERSHTPNWY